MCGHIDAGLLRADVSDPHRAPARFWTVGAMHCMATVACSMPTSVCSRDARKRKFQLFHFVQPLNMVQFLWPRLVIYYYTVCPKLYNNQQHLCVTIYSMQSRCLEERASASDIVS